MSDSTAPLSNVRVVEFAHERTAYAGKFLAGLGADVILLEPPDGHHARSFGPFADDLPGPERGLWWWHHQSSKRSVTVDLDGETELIRQLLGTADIVLDGEQPGTLEAHGLVEAELRAEHAGLTWITITPFGRNDPRSAEPSIDLTVLAEGGPVWSCGYDDHDLPPSRGGGNQGFQIAGHYAVMSALVALSSRTQTGRGQFVDVNMHAAANVTTEVATYGHLVNGQLARRQTGRHASPEPTLPTQFLCADGVYVNSGVPPRRREEYASMVEWLTELGLDEEFEETEVLRLGLDYERITMALIVEDPLVGEIFGAGRRAQDFLASRMSSKDYFLGSMRRGLPAGMILAPDEVLRDPHFVERGFPVEVFHEEIDRSVTHPGSPIRFTVSPMRPPGRAPHLDEHGADIRRDLDA